jgi:hypothetical protein
MIEAGAFQDCHLLKSLEFEFGAHLQQIEENDFAGTALTTLSFPNSLRSFFGSAFHGLHLTSVSFFPFPTALEFCDDMIPDISGCSLIRYCGIGKIVFFIDLCEILTILVNHHVRFAFCYFLWSSNSESSSAFSTGKGPRRRYPNTTFGTVR